MSTPDYSNAWLHVAGWLAVEVVLVAGLLLGASRCATSAAWRRMFCQAAMVAVLALIVGELSGAARLAAWHLGKWVGRGVEATSPPAARGAARGESRVETLGVFRPVARAASAPGEVASHAAEPAMSPPRPPAPAPVTPPAAHRGGLFPWLCFCWGLGALVVGGRACGGRLLLFVHALRRTGRADAKLTARVAQLALRLGLRRRVRVLRSTRPGSPMAYGWLRPTVVLPADFESRFNARQQEVVLAHEAAHLAAHDALWGWLADGVTALVWWHPAAWWLRRQFHNASESAADEASLLVAGGPKALAECLIELGSRLLKSEPAGHLGMAGFRSHLGRRVQSLLRLEDRPWSPPPPRRALAVQVFGAAAAVAVVISTTAWASPRALTQGETMNTTKLGWKQTLAAFGLAAAVATPDRLPAAETALPTPAATPVEATPATVTPAPGSQTIPVQDNTQSNRGSAAEVADGEARLNVTQANARVVGNASATMVVMPPGVSDGHPPGFTYSNFSSTGGLTLVDSATVVNNEIGLTPASPGEHFGAVWSARKQYCRRGFSTSFRFRITDPGSQSGTPPGGDGISFCVQNQSATADASEYGSVAGSTFISTNTIGVSLNTFWNVGTEPSGNFVGICINAGGWLTQKNLDETPINLKDGNVHLVRVDYDGDCMDVSIDGYQAIKRFPAPVGYGLDGQGCGWVGFGARTGLSWANQRILDWSFSPSGGPGAPTFSVSAAGSSPLSYQWHFDGDSNHPVVLAGPSTASAGLAPHPAAQPTAPAAQGGASTPLGSPAGRKSTGKERIEALLSSTVIDVGPWDGLPLGEVIRMLSEQSQRLDHAKSGVNFLVNQSSVPATQSPAPVDPATGLPARVSAVEPVDLTSVTIGVRFPLKHITMLDALDVIVKSADHPIRYTLEDYAVVFSPAPARAAMDTELGVCTFKLEKEGLIEGLQSAFGIVVAPLALDPGARSRQYQAALKSWLTALDVPVEGNRSVFYNETTGVLMVRAGAQDLQTIEAAVETLGGSKVGAVARPAGSGGKR